MDYLTFIKTNKGYSHFHSRTPEKLCEMLNSLASVESFSVVPLPSDPNDLMQQPLPLKHRAKTLGAWYKHEDIFAVYQGHGVKTYGASEKGLWYVTVLLDWDKEWKPATKNEVEAVLIREAYRRYAGKLIQFDGLGTYLSFDRSTDLEYLSESNALRALWWKNKSVELFHPKRGWAPSEESAITKIPLPIVENCSDQELFELIKQISSELQKRNK